MIINCKNHSHADYTQLTPKVSEHIRMVYNILSALGSREVPVSYARSENIFQIQLPWAQDTHLQAATE